jgi:hypothetical protein
MIKLVGHVLLLGMPFALLIGAFEFRYLKTANNQYLAKRQLLESVANEVEVLTLGSSHGYYGILPEVLGRGAFNLAATSQSIYYDRKILHKFLVKLPNLKTVVLPVSYFSLETQLDQAPERWRCYYYYRFYGIPHRGRAMAYDVRNFSLYFLYGRNSAKLMKNSAEFLNHDVLNDFDRWGGVVEGGFLKPADLHQSSVEALLRHHGMMKSENFADNVTHIQKMISMLQERQIRVILVTTPVTSYYRAGIRDDSFTRMQVALNEIARAKNVKYCNYFSDDRFNLSDFVDGDHLNRDGAIKFSKLLGREVLHL